MESRQFIPTDLLLVTWDSVSHYDAGTNQVIFLFAVLRSYISGNFSCRIRFRLLLQLMGNCHMCFSCILTLNGHSLIQDLATVVQSQY